MDTAGRGWASNRLERFDASQSLPHLPHAVTADALPDDEQVFGEAMHLIVDWREQRARFKTHWPSVEGLEVEVRMLELELELMEERRVNLPPD